MASWDPNLSVGVREIDDQHKELFKRIDGLLKALHESKGKEEALRLMSFLDDYVVDHFGAEAKLMKNRRYPGAAEHLAQHERFIGMLRELVSELNERGPTVSLALKINTQMGNWLRGHIMKTDRELAAFLKRSPEAGPRA